MALTDAGRDHIAKALIGEAVTDFDNTNAHLGVGDSSAAFAKTQTDLQGTNKFRRPMEATYPQRSGNVLTFKSSFGSSEANFAWAEWGAFNASTAGTMLNRAVASLGTKASGSTWVLTATVTVNNP